MEAIYFPTPDDFRQWLAEHHNSASQVLVGFYRKNTGYPSMSWAQSVDEALCFGWIDGIRRSVDAERYTIRFTPRRTGSTWSNVNIGRAKALIESGRMQAAGLRAFEARRTDRSGTYSFEQRSEAALPEGMLERFRADEAAWRFWERQPPGYRRTATWWVISAKQETTRLRRLEALIADSAAGRRVGPLRRKQD